MCLCVLSGIHEFHWKDIFNDMSVWSNSLQLNPRDSRVCTGKFAWPRRNWTLVKQDKKGSIFSFSLVLRAAFVFLKNVLAFHIHVALAFRREVC